MIYSATIFAYLLDGLPKDKVAYPEFRTTSVIASSADEAIGKATRRSEEIFPLSRGFRFHGAMVSSIPDSWIESEYIKTHSGEIA